MPSKGVPLKPPTQNERQRVINMLGSGASVEAAATAAGIGKKRLAAILERGRRGGKGNGLFMSFLEEVDQAQGRAEVTFATRVAKAAESSWQAAAWLLERGYEGWERPAVVARAGGEKDAPANVGTDPFADLDNVTEIKLGARVRDR